jgi:branched-chain amino acid transport system permease protein
VTLAVSRPATLATLLVGSVLAAGAGVLLPGFIVSILSLVLISALLAASVNMLAGEVGLVSIGHAGIAAVSAYGVAWATVHGHGLAVQIALASVLTLVASIGYGLLTMRSRGIVFLMITLALGMVVFGLASKLSSLTGGQNGLTGITRPDVLADGRVFYFFSLLVFVIVAAALYLLGRSPFGLTLRGVRDSEVRMASLGYSVPRVKFFAVIFSGAVAGLAGILAVWHSQFMSPATATFARSALAVVMVIVGGTGTVLGPLVGAGVVVGAEHWLSSYVERWPTVLGLVFVLVVLFAPRGVVGGAASIARRVTGDPRVDSAAPPASGAAAAVIGTSVGTSPLDVGSSNEDRWKEEETG